MGPQAVPSPISSRAVMNSCGVAGRSPKGRSRHPYHKQPLRAYNGPHNVHLSGLYHPLCRAFQKCGKHAICASIALMMNVEGSESLFCGCSTVLAASTDSTFKLSHLAV